MKKIDLHTHTVPTVSDSDFEFDITKVSQYVEKLELDALAITNHNRFDINQYHHIKNVLSIPVFPGIEINLEGGHLLLIAEIDEFEISNFKEKCDKVSALINSKEDFINLLEFRGIFSDLSKYLLIPHIDKKPALRPDVIEALQPHISSGEVGSVSKFKRAIKDDSKLVPVLFSDIRFHSQLKSFPTRHTYVDLDEISLSGIKSCLFDRTKISLSKEGGNDFFQATDDGLLLSTKLNIILGERSSGKTVTLNKIAASSGNAKYIKQFSLLQDDEARFNETNKARLSLINKNYLSDFQIVVEDVVKLDIKQNHIDIQLYLDSLKKFASENEKKDLYSKCNLFNEELFVLSDLSNLDKVIIAVTTLIENKEYKDTINRHISTNSLKNLAVELMQKSIDSILNNNKKDWINSIVKDIQRDLRIKTTGSFVEEVDFYKVAMDEVKVKKFDFVTSQLKTEREINKEELGKFSIVTKTSKIEGAVDLLKIGRDKKQYSNAFRFYKTPYEYLNKLRDLGVEDANLYKFFINISSLTYNQDGFIVSGGERSEFNLIHEIQDATKYDLLLIDEPESSFDNLFLKREINTIIKDISNLMPVVVVTHNNTVGASIKPNYVAVTVKSLEESKFKYRVYTGYPSNKELECTDGKKIKNFDAMLNCLEAGIDAYTERKDQTYDILKN